MTRRYTDVDSRLVVDLQPGDEVLSRRTITAVTREANRVAVIFDDGATQSFDLTGDPALEVVATKGGS